MDNNFTLDQLPYDVLFNIFKLLDVRDICSLMVTCKTLKNVLKNDNAMWKALAKETVFTLLKDIERKSSYYDWYRSSYNWQKGNYRGKKIQDINPQEPGYDPPGLYIAYDIVILAIESYARAYFGLFLTLFYHSTAATMAITDLVVIRHNKNFMPWLTRYNTEALLISFGSELCCYPRKSKGLPDCRQSLWKIKVPKTERHDIRTNDISRFLVKDDIIVCGNRDGCTSIYKLNNINKTPKLLCYLRDCHQNGKVEVTAVELMRNNGSYVITASSRCPHLNLFSCSEDSYNVAGSVDVGLGVRCLALHRDEDKLAVGANENNKPILIDISTGTLLLPATSSDFWQAVRDITWLDDTTMAYVTHSGRLQCVDTRTRDVVFDAVDPFQSSLYCLKTLGRAVVVGSSEYARCVLFDTRQCKRHVQMYFTHKRSSPVYSLDFDVSTLVAAADRSVAVLDFTVHSKESFGRDYSDTFELVSR